MRDASHIARTSPDPALVDASVIDARGDYQSAEPFVMSYNTKHIVSMAAWRH